MVGRKRRGGGGWSLVELTIVISVISILAGMALIGYRNAITRSREVVLKENLFRIRDGIDQFYADKGEYPISLIDLVSAGYLRAVPEDPFTRSSSSWQKEMAEFDVADPLSQGIYDVGSSFDGMASDGTPYSEW